jgi:hypothetical protein
MQTGAVWDIKILMFNASRVHQFFKGLADGPPDSGYKMVTF